MYALVLGGLVLGGLVLCGLVLVLGRLALCGLVLGGLVLFGLHCTVWTCTGGNFLCDEMQRLPMDYTQSQIAVGFNVSTGSLDLKLYRNHFRKIQ